jgi:hypothetical protein
LRTYRVEEHCDGRALPPEAMLESYEFLCDTSTFGVREHQVTTPKVAWAQSELGQPSVARGVGRQKNGEKQPCPLISGTFPKLYVPESVGQVKEPMIRILESQVVSRPAVRVPRALQETSPHMNNVTAAKFGHGFSDT